MSSGRRDMIHTFCEGSEARKFVVRPPGFGPGFLPWQGNVLDQARLRPLAASMFVWSVRFNMRCLKIFLATLT